MEKIPLIEKPCLYLQKTAFQGGPVINSIPAVRPQRAAVTCLCNSADDCPKARCKMDITMLCFRISRPKRKEKGST